MNNKESKLDNIKEELEKQKQPKFKKNLYLIVTGVLIAVAVLLLFF